MNAMDHLGKVLFLLSDLHPDCRCRALNDALAFYNESNPDAMIGPSGLPWNLMMGTMPGEIGPFGTIIAPREPTEKMVDTGLRATAAFLDIPGSGLTIAREKMRRRYMAMLEVAELEIPSADAA